MPGGIFRGQVPALLNAARLISSSRLPVVPAAWALRARGQTNKGNSSTLSFASSKTENTHTHTQSFGMGSQKCENGFPSSFDVKSLVSRAVYSLIKRKERGRGERWRWRGGGDRRKDEQESKGKESQSIF